MSTLLHVIALVIAIVNVPAAGGLTAWGLAGGDGEPDHAWQGVLALLVAAGSIYTAVTCWTAFWGLPEWRFWPMFVAPAAGTVGLLGTGRGPDDTLRDLGVGIAMQLAMVVPPVLLLFAGVPDL